MKSTGLPYTNETANNGEVVLTQWIGSYSVRARNNNESCQLYCHIPVVQDGQSPVMVNEVWSEPSGKVAGFTINKNYTGLNALLAIEFDDLSLDEKVTVFFNVTTLIKSNNYEDIPTSLDIPAEDMLPDEVKKWLESTEFIQSDHWRINLVAHVLKGFDNDLIKTANHVTFFTGNIIRYKGYFSQDALSTLRRHFAVCTGKADLGVALLRANGIPARVLMVYPTHYIIEYYAHPYGWIRSETTMGQMPYPNQRYTVAYEAYPEDETSSHVVNGLSPYLGVIAYWGTSNPKVSFGIDYSNWSMPTNHEISASEDTINEALHLTKKAWSYYMNYTGSDLTETQTSLYHDAITFQETAISCFLQDDTMGYRENMQLACDTYIQIK
jgi:hypothetical protein